jgi:hypothetical protein
LEQQLVLVPVSEPQQTLALERQSVQALVSAQQ